MRQRGTISGLAPAAALCLCVLPLFAAEHTGVVRFNGQPVPGASVTVTQGDRRQAVISGPQGEYRVTGLDDGPFTVAIEMQLFAPERRDFNSAAPPATWDLKLLDRQEIARRIVHRPPTGAGPYQRANVKATATPGPPKQEAEDTPPAELTRQAADGLLVNGSVHNALSSPFSQLPGFGNNRRGRPSLYNGNLGIILNHAAFDARAFSLTGQNTPKPDYSRLQGLVSFGGPIKIPRLLPIGGPNVTVNYQWTRNSNASTQSGLMPTAAQRAGVFAQPITDPLNGNVFPGGTIPASRLSPQALTLLRLYPEPNFPANGRYNYQAPLVSGYHQDDLQARGSKQVKRNFYSANFAWQSTRTDTPNLFGFLDNGRVNGVNATAAYRRNFGNRTFLNLSINFNRLRTQIIPWFSNRENVSGAAGIGGNNQEPVNWGPPNLNFSQGITPLTSAQASLVRNQTGSVAADYFMNRGRHNISSGLTLRRQQFNILAQQDARGTFTFTGAAAGNDFAGFLLGIPDASSIAFGNADKYLRGSIAETFINDDWRVNPSLTINAGLRWEYWSPVTEKYGRLVNLDIGGGFTTATPSSTLPQPDRNNFAPRAAFSWRPLAASSMVIRGGYGVYFDTSIYQPIALDMAQQAPLSKSLRVANSAATPLTLAAGFPTSAATSTPTFAVDQDFRTGYAHMWQLTLQRDLPAALQITAAYLGNKGTGGQQQILPNTYPGLALTPSGFAYLMSNGNSSRHAGQVQVRRRLRSGFAGQLQYTWAKSIDNSLPGGRGRSLIAQNWLDLRGERGRSNLDQRHLVTTSVQYTSGMGLGGGALSRGWLATLLKEWTLASDITWGTGLPLTPVYASIASGTGFTGNLRPDYTGAPLYDAPPGLALNPAALAIPAPGTWGNAGRNSITGPRQFAVNSTLGRTFRSSERWSVHIRMDATNASNTPTFASWNTIAGNAQFGLPDAVNPMRTMQLTCRVTF